MSGATAVMIDHLDDIVLTVADIEAICAFHQKGLGLRVETVGESRKAQCSGKPRIKPHAETRAFEPRAISDQRASPIRSIDPRDPDRTLIEVSRPREG